MPFTNIFNGDLLKRPLSIKHKKAVSTTRNGFFMLYTEGSPLGRCLKIRRLINLLQNGLPRQ
jgi:hypothetical protein